MDPVNGLVIPFVSGFFNVLLDRLASNEVKDFLIGRDSTKRHVSKLKTMMLVISKVLSDAEEKQITDQFVKTWFNDVKDTLYDIEDLLDDIQTEALRCKVEDDTESRSDLGRVLTSSAALLDPFHEGFDSRIKEMNSKLEEFREQVDVLGLKAGGFPRVSTRRLPTTSLVDEMRVYGRDSEREQIISFLQDDVPKDVDMVKGKKQVASAKGKIRIVAIVGLPGIGKTTLAQVVYNDPRIDESFDLNSWVFVSEVFDIFGITKAICGSVSDNNDVDLDSLQNSLCERIKRRKFIIVLDDVWNENFNSWDTLLLPLKAAASGSTVIVTTRNSSVAAMMQANFTLNLSELPDEHCWRLLAEIAFGDLNPPSDVRLEIIGKKVAAMCRGLPLSIRTLGGLLRSTSRIEEWEAILKSRIWDLPADCNDILPALLLSYDCLPSHLKRCFAYCSIFPKQFRFEEHKMVLLWMAEGFVQMPRNGTRIEEVGKAYFYELVSRSFFQPSSPTRSSFMMHDSIHELAVYINQEFGSFIGLSDPQSLSQRTRHLAYVQTSYDYLNRFQGLRGVDRLRTFLPLGSKDLHSCYLSPLLVKSLEPMFHCLRVLSLSHYKIANIPISLGSLKHLRYLDLSFTSIHELPESICTLYNLQTLLLSYCCSLLLLPMGLGKLISLRHLDLRGTKLQEMPRHISNLSTIQTLTNFVVGRNRGASVSELRELQQLRGNLYLSGLRNVFSAKDAFLSDLENKMFLHGLDLDWDNDDCDDSERERLLLHALSPHMNLRVLTIKYYGGTSFPDWLGAPTYEHIIRLHLSNCDYCFSLPPLGQLQALEELSIENFERLQAVGKEFYGEIMPSIPSFSSLKTLRFANMPRWRVWDVVDPRGTFHRLEELSLHMCQRLVGDLPSELISLKKFVIKNCPKLAISLPSSPQINTLTLHFCEKVDISSLGELTSLTSINLFFTRSSVSAAPDLQQLTSLKELSAYGCCALHNFQDIVLPLELESLTISSAVRPPIVRFNTHDRPSLQLLTIPHSVKAISISGFDEIEAPLHRCTSLQYMLIDASKYKCLEHLPWGCYRTLNYLEIRSLINLKNFHIISEEGDEAILASLYDLSIMHCDRLVAFPGGLNAPNLTTLCISKCQALESLPEGMNSSLASLLFLCIENCPLVKSFPPGGLPTNLLSLHINSCGSIKSLPEGMHSLVALQSLSTKNCPRLESFPDGLLPPNLQKLWVSRCHKLMDSRKEWRLRQLYSLEILLLERCIDVETFPEDYTLPVSLSSLFIHSFYDLRCLNCEELQRLHCLRELSICRCPKLQAFSANGLPHFISSLQIMGCPLLEQPS